MRTRHGLLWIVAGVATVFGCTVPDRKVTVVLGPLGGTLVVDAGLSETGAPVYGQDAAESGGQTNSFPWGAGGSSSGVGGNPWNGGLGGSNEGDAGVPWDATISGASGGNARGGSVGTGGQAASCVPSPTPSNCRGNTPQYCDPLGRWQDLSPCIEPAPTCYNGTCECTGTICDSHCVDLTADPLHCGTCNTNCLGGTCLDGLCQALLLYQGSAQSTIRSVAVDETNLYLADQGVGEILEQHLPRQTPLRLATGQNTPTEIAVDSGYVYWLNRGDVARSNGSINRIAIGGGAIEPLATEQQRPKSLYLDNGNVYWVAPNGIFRTPKTSASPTRIVTAASAGHIVVNEDNLYWTDDVANQLMMYPLSGGTSTPISSLPREVSALGIDIWALYFIGAETFYFVPLDGGEPTPVLTNQGGGDVIWSDGTILFWSDPVDGRILKADGTRASVVIKTAVTGMAVGKNAIYWSTGTTSVYMLAR